MRKNHGRSSLFSSLPEEPLHAMVILAKFAYKVNPLLFPSSEDYAKLVLAALTAAGFVDNNPR